MIGNAVDAALAAMRPTEFHIGSGCTRSAYLINGVVYKVHHDDFAMDNYSEMENAAKMRSYLVEGIEIPEMTIYGDVLAMEYIDGMPTGECDDEWFGNPCSHMAGECMDQSVIKSIGWLDPSYGNAIKDMETGIIYIIDVAG